MTNNEKMIMRKWTIYNALSAQYQLTFGNCII